MSHHLCHTDRGRSRCVSCWLSSCSTMSENLNWLWNVSQNCWVIDGSFISYSNNFCWRNYQNLSKIFFANSKILKFSLKTTLKSKLEYLILLFLISFIVIIDLSTYVLHRTLNSSLTYKCYHPVTFLIRFYIRYCLILN